MPTQGGDLTSGASAGENGLTDDTATFSRTSTQPLANGGVTESIDDIPDMSNASSCSIAICGLALRLPGGINDTESFWALLHDGKDARIAVPPDRYNVRGFDQSLGGTGAIQTEYGYFLSQDLACLDTSFFTMTRMELERVDPQQRQLLEVVRECFENAGETRYRGEAIGCYVGTFGEDWLYMTTKDSQHSGRYGLTGHADLMLANRVSYEYDLRGPSMVIKTGCSASLLALHEACRALQAGDCSSAIVAGTSLILGPTTTSAMTQEGILSPDGSCKSFDEAANGFARGEAINAVFLKRLNSAIADGSPIRAIIRSTASNSDGKGKGFMTPNGESQEALMRKAYRDAGLDPKDTAFVECHGTGTPTGDPIETSAVGEIFGEHGVIIGSVKPNVGHSEGASGLTSLIKAILTLEHGIIPPNIKFSNPNPKIPFAEKRLRVPLVPTPWPKDRAQRVSVNSFGIGGSNAHVILDSAAKFQSHNSNGWLDKRRDLQLLIFSANTSESLRRQIGNYIDYVDSHPSRLAELAYTLSSRREHLSYRAFSITNSSLRSISPIIKATKNLRQVAFVFSGQGAQWPKMASELINENPQFRSDIKAMDSILQKLKFPPSWTLEEQIRHATNHSRVHDAEIAQPLCTAIQICLVNLLMRSGIKPKAVVGHSSGEIVAAYASGALSVYEAIVIAHYRGYITKTQSVVTGGMAAVGLGSVAVSQFLREGVVLACENSPSSTTVSGDLEPLKEVLSRIQSEKPDVLVRRLKVDMAYHSHQMQALGAIYRRLLEDELGTKKLVGRRMNAQFFSSVTGKSILDCDAFDAEYWVSNLVSRVRFERAVGTLLCSDGDVVFVEIGPHSTLAGPIQQICAAADISSNYVPTMLRERDCIESILSAYGQLYQMGITFDFGTIAEPSKILTDLPTYSWDHSTPYWNESRLSHDWRFREFGYHVLLGERVAESSSIAPSWRNTLNLDQQRWLTDHKLLDDVVFPFAGYVTMAGEAVRQVTRSECYSLQHVIARVALVLHPSKPTEVITTLKPHRLTDVANSTWYDFTISSFSGSIWTKHCAGQVRPLLESTQKLLPSRSLHRQIAPKRWYKAMANVGLAYGKSFKCLSTIASATTEPFAVGSITIQDSVDPEPFTIHPAIVDACLQLALVALTKGESRNLRHLSIPTVIEKLDVIRRSRNMQATAWRSDEERSINVECLTDGKPTLRLSGVQVTHLDAHKASIAPDTHAAARLEWYPSFDFMDVSSLFTPPNSDNEEMYLREQLCLLCMLDSKELLRELCPIEPHFKRYQQWLEQETIPARLETNPLIRNPESLIQLSRSVRHQLIEEFSTRLLRMCKPDITRGIIRTWQNAEAMYSGRASALDVLMLDSLLTKIYDSVSFGHGDFVRALSCAKPKLRILEVGAGTGGTTQLILDDLVDMGCYSLYTFTDISAGFFPQAKDRFQRIPNMEFKVFDISRSPFDQGLEAASYDLILAPNVIHATPCLQNTLQNLRPLLRSDGHLVLTELCTLSKTPNYVFGNFAGWWLGEADDRKHEPYVSIERWDSELKAAGFTGIDAAVPDAEQPYHMCIAIVSQPMKILPPNESRITILCDHPGKGVSLELINYFNDIDFTTSVVSLEDYNPQCADNVLFTLDLEHNFFREITEKRLLAFQDLLRSWNSERCVLWLTKPAQMSCKDPRSAQSIGVARAIRSELGIAFCTLEIDQAEPNFSKLVSSVFKKLDVEQATEENLIPDREFVVHKGVINIGRYRPFVLQEEFLVSGGESLPRPRVLEIVRLGQIDTLHWAEREFPVALGASDVEIESRSLGLNFKDVLSALGLISSLSNEPLPLGLEVTGIIRRVGSAVHDLAVGDRVLALSPDGCFQSHPVLPGLLCLKIPENMGFEEAATIPLCFTTAVQALIEVGQLLKDQTVLIHSACGGVGLAAIQICKHIGAKIFVTVSTTEKAQHLVDNFQIPRHHILYSRDESFLDDLMHQTGNRGVDVVLNSLAGELLHTSWKCVAEFGKLIEIGRQDLAHSGMLSMQPFLANRSYCCVDVAHLMRKRPGHMNKVLEQCLRMYLDGLIRPIHPMTVFEPMEITSAFRHLQDGDHIGKVVVSMPEASTITAAPRERTLRFDPGSAYLLVGGLGGLGKAVATWMIEHGAKSLVFLTRHSRVDEQSFFEELHSLGCATLTVLGSVESPDNIQEAIKKSQRTIKGVIQLAMVLCDSVFTEMSYSDWLLANAPKVDGTWNLHNAFLNQPPLDFFFLTSSITSVVNQPGQSNYNAANTFLEAFCQFRHSLGLAASVLNVAALDDIGFVAESSVARKKLASQGFYFLGEQEFLDCMRLSILNSQPQDALEPSLSRPWKNHGQIVMGLRSEIPLDHPDNRTKWRHDRRMAIYHGAKSTITQMEVASSDKLKSFLSNITDPESLCHESSVNFIAHEIGRKVFDLMLKPELDPEISSTLTQIGLDSLMAIELRMWWHQVFGFQISVLEIMASGTLENLGRGAAEGMRKRLVESDS